MFEKCVELCVCHICANIFLNIRIKTFFFVDVVFLDYPDTAAADAETYITRKNNAQILNIQVTGELGSENAAAWSLWFHPRKLFVALKNGA